MHGQRGSGATAEVDGRGAVGLADRDVEHDSIVERAFEQVKRLTTGTSEPSDRNRYVPTTTTTKRLVLDPVTPDHVDDLYALSSDPRVWTHLPSGRHISRVQT